MMKKGLASQNTFLDTIATRFDGTHSNFVLGNAQAQGCPVVYCSDGFCELTGFPRSQVMGRSCACKFLFGEDTLVEEKDKIDEALENKRELKTELNFYKKDGDVFKCLLDIVPIKNEKSQVVLILVSHKDIGDKQKSDDNEEKSSEEDELNSSDEEMAEAFRRCQVRQGRSSAALPGTAGYNSQRRRSRAVLYHLSGQFDKQNRANRAKSKLQQFNKLGSISAKMPEYKVQEVKKSRFILVHYGIFKIGWDWLILLCTFYTAILVPFNAAFTRSEKGKDQRDSIYSDVVVEILFMFDILFNFRTSFVNKSGQVVYQARLIALNYIRGWFLLDLLAAIPFDFLYIFQIKSDAPVHLLKVARLLRLARLLQKLDRFSQYSALVLVLLMIMFTLLAHWLACVWYAIGQVEFENHETAGWLYELSERLDLHPERYINSSSNATVVKPDVLMSYVSALYFTCTSITSVGFGNVSANTSSEKIFSICAMIIGALMHALVFGNVTALIQRLYQRRANFHSKTKDLKDFFRAYDIPKPLKQRMQEYFQTMWSMNNGIEATEILKDFPEEMKGELGLHLHREILNLPIFEEAQQGCLKSVALHTRRSFCAPGEFLVHKGDAANYLYLLVSGSMEILDSDMVVAILGKGDLFGAHIDFDDPISVCNYDIRSLTYSELQCINIKGLVDVLLLYPDFAEKFAKDIHNDLTYNLRQTSEDSDEESKGSPKGRVFTLPSISEDDEISESDEDQDSGKTDIQDDEDQDSPTYPQPSCSSPLLPQTKYPQKLPNGDLASMEGITNSPNARTWGLRRGSANITRNSIKETRKMRLGCHQNDAVVEKIIPHVQNLQNEIEGTKAVVGKLERKIAKIGHDISAIDRNMREILKHIVNSSKMAPLEPIFPATPNTPYSTHSHFNFDQTDSRENLRVDRDQHQGYMYKSERELPDIGGESHEKLNKEFVCELPLLLNPHDALIRRHSDGPLHVSKKPVDSVLTTAKSDHSIRKPFPANQTSATGAIIQNNKKENVIETETSFVTSVNENVLVKGEPLSDSGSDLLNGLEEIHSRSCFNPDRRRNSDIVTSFHGKVDPCDRKVRKSITYGNFKSIPTLKIDRSDDVVPDVIKDNRPHMTTNTNKLETCLFDACLSSAKQKISTAPKKSSSCYEMKSKDYVPLEPKLDSKSKSFGMLITEFGTSTPNEVKTVHIRQDQFPSENVNQSSNNFHTRSKPHVDKTNKEAIESDSLCLSEESRNLRISTKAFPDSSNLERVKYDSGNVSLLDAVDGDIETPLSDPSNAPFNKKHISDIDLKDTIHYKERSGRLDRNRPLYSDSIEVSPDSVTDITESLQTDSAKTDDETIVDIDSGQDVLNVLRSIEGGHLRSTDL